MGKQEVITYKSRDGKYDIQGMLIYPTNYQAGTSVPLITVVHGVLNRTTATVGLRAILHPGRYLPPADMPYFTPITVVVPVVVTSLPTAVREIWPEKNLMIS